MLATVRCVIALICAASLVENARGVPIFGPAAPVTELNSIEHEGVTYISPDGLTLLLESNRGDGTRYDIYQATRPGLNSPFSTPAQGNFATVNTDNGAFNVGYGVLSDDGLELFYHFANSGTKRAFYHTTRASTGDIFPAGSEVTTINLPTTEFRRPSFISSDGLRLYYFADNGGNSCHGK